MDVEIEKEIAKLYEERKYAKESAENYGDCVRCVIVRFSLCFSTAPFLKNLLPSTESNSRCTP